MASASNQTEDLEEKYVDIVYKFITDIDRGKIVGSSKLAVATVDMLEQLISDTQHPTMEKIVGSSKLAVATVDMLEQLISDTQHPTMEEMVARVRAAGKLLTQGAPAELVVANMVRRVLRVIRDVHTQAVGVTTAEGGGASLQRLVRGEDVRGAEAVCPASLLTNTRALLAELRTELEASADAIAEQASEHIHADELVLTYGASDLAERFLRRAAATRQYQLIVVEDQDHNASQAMAARLSECGVQVTLVGLWAAAAVLARVNKLVCAVGGVLNGGGLRAGAGLASVAEAARHYRVPLYVLSPLYTLSPLHDFHQVRHALDYTIGMGDPVMAPKYDHVAADRVTLFITNLGGSSPSYVYRLLSELYDARDYQL